jgi:hypothetical protein
MNKRKELVFTYMQTPRPMGVYQITNTLNGKMLIGSSPNLDGKFNRFQFELKLGVHGNKELQREWNEFGEQAFTFEIIDRIKPVEDMKHDYSKEIEAMESKWLDQLQPYGDRGYNKI